MNDGVMTRRVRMDDRTKLRVTLAAISKEAEILGDRFCGVVRTDLDQVHGKLAGRAKGWSFVVPGCWRVRG